jgi:phage major head subunit gpT-like protein
MKINVTLNRNSIQKAIKTLKQQKKILLEQAIPEYLKRSAERIQELANQNLNMWDIGDNVKEAINDSWFIKNISNTHIVLYNISRKAAYVEFGVGIIGQTDKHPNADNTGYEYNVQSEYKFGQGFWQFTVEDRSWLDIPEDAIIYQDFNKAGESIITQGTQGAWYLFNAMEDFKLREAKPLWEQVKKKYWSK